MGVLFYALWRAAVALLATLLHLQLLAEGIHLNKRLLVEKV
jgi:hypothetical protein